VNLKKRIDISTSAPCFFTPLNHPDHRLIVYGTLMENETNAYLLNDLRTKAEKVKIWGKVDRSREYPYYRYFLNTDAKNGQLHDEIVAELYESPFLPQIIHKLDLFEGPTYKRIRIPFEHNGTECFPESSNGN
jgi:gamma-glutamylcyclotransferase (GGCT)/AIG2-like uncharacterized protein YtfP